MKGLLVNSRTKEPIAVVECGVSRRGQIEIPFLKERVTAYAMEERSSPAAANVSRVVITFGLLETSGRDVPSAMPLFFISGEEACELLKKAYEMHERPLHPRDPALELRAAIERVVLSGL